MMASKNVAFRTPLTSYEKTKSLNSKRSMITRLKLKEIDGETPGIKSLA